MGEQRVGRRRVGHGETANRENRRNRGDWERILGAGAENQIFEGKTAIAQEPRGIPHLSLAWMSEGGKEGNVEGGRFLRFPSSRRETV